MSDSSIPNTSSSASAITPRTPAPGGKAAVGAGGAVPSGQPVPAAGTAYWAQHGSSTYQPSSSANPAAEPKPGAPTEGDVQIAAAALAAGITPPSAKVVAKFKAKIKTAGPPVQKSLEELINAVNTLWPKPTAATVKALSARLTELGGMLGPNDADFSPTNLVFLAMRHQVQEQVADCAYHLQVMQQRNQIAADISQYIDTLRTAQTNLEQTSKAKSGDTGYSNSQTVPVEVHHFDSFSGTNGDGHAFSTLVKDPQTNQSNTALNNDGLSLEIKTAEAALTQANTKKDMAQQAFQTADSSRSTDQTQQVGTMKMLQELATNLNNNIR